MSQIEIVGFYAALNGLIALALAINVGRTRSKLKVMLGDGGHEELLRATRAHSNNTEYAPLILVLLALLAIQNASVLVLHGLGAALTLGRAAHGFGLSTNAGASLGRGIGMLFTLIALIGSILALIHHAFA